MEAQELRDKLTEYIKTADERKLNAIYTLVEDEVEVEYKWWEDEAFVAALQEEEQKIKSGEIKGYTEEEANARFYARMNKIELAHV